MSLKITEYKVLADVKEDLTLLFFSDTHNCRNESFLKILSQENADAVLCGGDILHNHLMYKNGFEFLSEASRLLPAFYSLGNHEWGYLGELRSDIIKTGVTLLDNEFVSFKGINIGGLTSAYFRMAEGMVPDIDFLTSFSQLDGYKLLLCHHPEYYPKYIRDLPIDLILSGHAHGGQWRLFGRGAYAPGQGILPKYTSGIYDGRLIISRGIGNVYPVPKINNPPEVVKIKLQKTNNLIKS